MLSIIMYATVNKTSCILPGKVTVLVERIQGFSRKNSKEISLHTSTLS